MDTRSDRQLISADDGPPPSDSSTQISSPLNAASAATPPLCSTCTFNRPGVPITSLDEHNSPSMTVRSFCVLCGRLTMSPLIEDPASGMSTSQLSSFRNEVNDEDTGIGGNEIDTSSSADSDNNSTEATSLGFGAPQSLSPLVKRSRPADTPSAGSATFSQNPLSMPPLRLHDCIDDDSTRNSFATPAHACATSSVFIPTSVSAPAFAPVSVSASAPARPLSAVTAVPGTAIGSGHGSVSGGSHNDAAATASVAGLFYSSFTPRGSRSSQITPTPSQAIDPAGTYSQGTYLRVLFAPASEPAPEQRQSMGTVTDTDMGMNATAITCTNMSIVADVDAGQASSDVNADGRAAVATTPESVKRFAPHPPALPRSAETAPAAGSIQPLAVARQLARSPGGLHMLGSIRLSSLNPALPVPASLEALCNRNHDSGHTCVPNPDSGNTTCPASASVSGSSTPLSVSVGCRDFTSRGAQLNASSAHALAPMSVSVSMSESWFGDVCGNTAMIPFANTRASATDAKTASRPSGDSGKAATDDANLVAPLPVSMVGLQQLPIDSVGSRSQPHAQSQSPSTFELHSQPHSQPPLQPQVRLPCRPAQSPSQSPPRQARGQNQHQSASHRRSQSESQNLSCDVGDTAVLLTPLHCAGAAELAVVIESPTASSDGAGFSFRDNVGNINNANHITSGVLLSQSNCPIFIEDTDVGFANDAVDVSDSGTASHQSDAAFPCDATQRPESAMPLLFGAFPSRMRLAAAFSFAHDSSLTTNYNNIDGVDVPITSTATHNVVSDFGYPAAGQALHDNNDDKNTTTISNNKNNNNNNRAPGSSPTARRRLKRALANETCISDDANIFAHSHLSDGDIIAAQSVMDVDLPSLPLPQLANVSLQSQLMLHNVVTNNVRSNFTLSLSSGASAYGAVPQRMATFTTFSSLPHASLDSNAVEDVVTNTISPGTFADAMQSNAVRFTAFDFRSQLGPCSFAPTSLQPRLQQQQHPRQLRQQYEAFAPESELAVEYGEYFHSPPPQTLPTPLPPRPALPPQQVLISSLHAKHQESTSTLKPEDEDESPLSHENESGTAADSLNAARHADVGLDVQAAAVDAYNRATLEQRLRALRIAAATSQNVPAHNCTVHHSSRLAYNCDSIQSFTQHQQSAQQLRHQPQKQQQQLPLQQQLLQHQQLPQLHYRQSSRCHSRAQSHSSFSFALRCDSEDDKVASTSSTISVRVSQQQQQPQQQELHLQLSQTEPREATQYRGSEPDSRPQMHHVQSVTNSRVFAPRHGHSYGHSLNLLENNREIVSPTLRTGETSRHEHNHRDQRHLHAPAQALDQRRGSLNLSDLGVDESHNNSRCDSTAYSSAVQTPTAIGTPVPHLMPSGLTLSASNDHSWLANGNNALAFLPVSGSHLTTAGSVMTPGFGRGAVSIAAPPHALIGVVGCNGYVPSNFTTVSSLIPLAPAAPTLNHGFSPAISFAGAHTGGDNVVVIRTVPRDFVDSNVAFSTRAQTVTTLAESVNTAHSHAQSHNNSVSPHMHQHQCPQQQQLRLQHRPWPQTQQHQGSLQLPQTSAVDVTTNISTHGISLGLGASSKFDQTFVGPHSSEHICNINGGSSDSKCSTIKNQHQKQ